MDELRLPLYNPKEYFEEEEKIEKAKQEEFKKPSRVLIVDISPKNEYEIDI